VLKVVLKVAPGAIAPEFHWPAFATDVCVVESLFFHVTVLPTETVIGLGLYAVVVIVCAPGTIETFEPEPLGVGAAGEDELEQPTDTPTSRIARVSRTNIEASV
jgi:hypothetical protein